MGLYCDRILPVATDIALRGPVLDAVRARVVAGCDGEVLEVGFGSGRNLPHYPSVVRRLLAVEPAAGGLRLAAARVDASPFPVEHVGLDGEALPLGDRTVDHVVVTWTLCSIPDVEQALAEVARVLRPGGVLHFAEHGLANDAGVARWQDRLTPLQRRLFGGCHLNRPIDRLIAASGLELAGMTRYALPGPRVFGSMYEGTAIRAGRRAPP